jgi:hypothetical protein
MIELVLPILEKHKANMFMCGHDAVFAKPKQCSGLSGAGSKLRDTGKWNIQFFTKRKRFGCFNFTAKSMLPSPALPALRYITQLSNDTAT